MYTFIQSAIGRHETRAREYTPLICPRHFIFITAFIGAAAVGAPAAGGQQSPTRPVSADSLATVRVKPVHDGVPVAGTIVRSDSIAQAVGPDGTAILRLMPGPRTIVALRIGFVPDTAHVDLSAGQDTTIVLSLEPQASDIEGIIISATRSERRVDDTPLRVEVIDQEEVAEKAAMTPGDIAMMMNETSGLRVATTSPSLGGANVRIQGLRGRYTLMLTDGLPLYGGQGGFGLLQIPPLDLARAEVIKGTASALYGSAALGGVINLVSRRARDSTEREVLLNQTSRGGTDVVFYGSGRPHENSPIGMSLLFSGHRQQENDVDQDGWADMPGYTRAVVRPRFFVDHAGRSLFVTAGMTGENRAGGTVSGGTTPSGTLYEEALTTRRGDAGVVGRMVFGERHVLSARASGTEQRHEHRFGDVREDDVHRTAFVEASAASPRGRSTMVGGFAYQQDQYVNASVDGFDYSYRVPSAFAQLDVDAARWIVISASGRVDWHNVYGTSLSPRLSALIRAPTEGLLTGWTARLSSGSGTFAPGPLTEETEATGLTPLRRLTILRRERAVSGSLDVNGPLRTVIGTLELNATVYGSRITDPVAVRELTTRTADGVSELELVNAPSPARNWGAEMLVRWVRDGARVTATYAYLRASEWDPSSVGNLRRDLPLAPRHTAGVVGSIEREGVSRLGIELYYTGRQALENNPYRAVSRPYLIVGFLGERQVATPVGRARLFINAENIGNVRQTRFDPLVLRSRGPGGRWTTDAWTELAGVTINGGVRLAF